MKKIPLGGKRANGRFVIVDDDDFKKFGHLRFYAHSGGGSITYAASRYLRSRGSTLLHKHILPGIAICDHINGDSLDNRKLNLRPCTQSENLCNKRKGPGKSSKYKGVYFDKERKMWRARVIKNGHTTWCGRFDSELMAAKARDAMAMKIHGAFASLNAP